MNESEIHLDDVDDTLCHFADNYGGGKWVWV
jgi:hypothetical protein